MNDQTNTQTQEAQENSKVEIRLPEGFDNRVDFKPYKFSFKTQVIKDNEGNEVTKTKRPTVELTLPVPSVEGCIAALESGDKKQIDLLLEAMEGVILSKAREIVNDKEDISQDNFPFTDITWETLANAPEAERKGRGIPAEVWKDFAGDYIAVMPALTGKTEKQISNAADILVDKFNKLKTNKDYKKIVRLLLDQLAIYISNSPNAETYMECVTFLTDKGNKILTQEEQSLLEAL